MQHQINILNEISQLLHNEANCQYEGLNCIFEIEDAQEETMDTTFKYTLGGVSKNVGISDSAIWSLLDLVLELHALMKAHTGGSWTKFTLSLDKAGKATTKFEYPDKS